MADNESEEKAIPSKSDETIASRSQVKPTDETLPSRPKPAEKPVETSLQPDAPKPVSPPDSKLSSTPINPPWTLQQFFNGEIDLDIELSKRFPNVPVMSTIHFRGLGTRNGRGVATLSTGDGSASVVFDADAATRIVQVSFTFGSMLTLRFTLDELSDMDRSRWVELMRREQGGLAFLWGPARWQHDYVICIARKYFTNFFAFSPHNFEAAMRMTPDVTKKLLNWLEEFWKAPPPDQEPPKLLTW